MLVFCPAQESINTGWVNREHNQNILRNPEGKVLPFLGVDCLLAQTRLLLSDSDTI